MGVRPARTGHGGSPGRPRAAARRQHPATGAAVQDARCFAREASARCGSRETHTLTRTPYHTSPHPPGGRGAAGAGTPSGTVSASASLYSFDLGPDADDIPPSAALAGAAPALGGGPLGGGGEPDGGGQGIALVVDAQARAPPCAPRAGRCLDPKPYPQRACGAPAPRANLFPAPWWVRPWNVVCSRLPVPRAKSPACPGGSKPGKRCSRWPPPRAVGSGRARARARR